MKRSVFAFFLIVVAGLTASAAPKFNSDVQAVYAAHDLALNLTKKLKLPPPQVAFILGVANKAAVTSAQNSANAPLAYYAAFTEVYSMVYPAERAFFQNDLVVTGSDKLVVNAAQTKARQLWAMVAPIYAEASKPAQPAWPADGYETGGWKPTLPKFAQPVYPNWNKLPMHSGLQSDIVLKYFAPIPYNTPEYIKELNEVRALGEKNSTVRTEEQTRIALFWAGNGGTVTPPGMWVEIAMNLLKQKRADFRAASTVMNLTAQALSDASVLAWSAKYVNASCRPITAIEQLTGNKNWVPLLDTPPFPSWVSGHSTFSAAAAVVLDIVVARGQMPVLVKSEAVPNHTRKFDTAWAAAREAGASRIYGGIHFQDDNVDGLKVGRLIGCTVLLKNGFSCPQ